MTQHTSPTYFQRKEWLGAARRYAIALSLIFVVLLLAANFAEVFVVRVIIQQARSIGEVIGLLIGVFVGLGLYTFVLARLTLHLVYRLNSARWASTVTLGLFLAVYVFTLPDKRDTAALIPLATSKVFSLLLFVRFWESQISGFRQRHKNMNHPRMFLVSWPAFLVCRWLLAACWLLSYFGFALAVVSADPVINMTGWESVTLIGALYGIFRIFVRNPLAHPEWKGHH